MLADKEAEYLKAFTAAFKTLAACALIGEGPVTTDSVRIAVDGVERIFAEVVRRIQEIES